MKSYADSLRAMQSRYLENVAIGPLFTTNANPDALWHDYLNGFSDPATRQLHNCSACRHFIKTYGGLVVIDKDGNTTPLFWHPEDAEPVAVQPISNMYSRVQHAGVTGVFLSSEEVWGQPEAGGFDHLHLRSVAVWSSRTKTAGQAMAERLEDFSMVYRAMADYPPEVVTVALSVLESDQLYRSEKVLGVAKWFADLQQRRGQAKGWNRTNIVWRAVAEAPAGFCHIRSSMIGTLLDDVAEGLSFKELSARFAAKMHPLRYQRPQAAPKDGTIKRAEELFAQLELASALPRRMARIEEIPLLWAPKKEQAEGQGLFGHLKTKADRSLMLPATPITVRKFVEEVAGEVESMEVRLEDRQRFIHITTAVNPDAPKLFQWNHPFSWYLWAAPPQTTNYGVRSGWNPVAGVTRLPARWNDDEGKYQHRGDGLIFLVEGARERQAGSAAIFPEHMRSELHEVRSVIEAHSRSQSLSGLEEGSAIGVDVRMGQPMSVMLRVKLKGREQVYLLDRWD